jgi:hypothetical protein
LTRPNTSARNPLPDDGSHPGGIKSESRAASSRYRWATSSESAVDISRRYRDVDHPQYWGRISPTAGDFEAEHWLESKFRQLGITNIRSQPIAYLNPEWAPKSWEVLVVSGSQTMKLTSAQPPYGAVSTNGKVLDLPIVYVGP